MTDEVFTLMRCFPNSRINMHGDVILSEKGNVYINAKEVEDKNTIISKLLEFSSRAIAKGEPYSTDNSNRNWRRSMLLGLNNYLKTNFTEYDLWFINVRLGNAINHERTLKFIESGFDMAVLKRVSK